MFELTCRNAEMANAASPECEGGYAFSEPLTNASHTNNWQAPERKSSYSVEVIALR
jgi:hypothetical protein